MKSIVTVDVHNIHDNGEKIALILANADSMHIIFISNARKYLLELRKSHHLIINYPTDRRQLCAMGKVFKLYEYKDAIL